MCTYSRQVIWSRICLSALRRFFKLLPYLFRTMWIIEFDCKCCCEFAIFSNCYEVLRKMTLKRLNDKSSIERIFKLLFEVQGMIDSLVRRYLMKMSWTDGWWSKSFVQWCVIIRLSPKSMLTLSFDLWRHVTLNSINLQASSFLYVLSRRRSNYRFARCLNKLQAPFKQDPLQQWK